MSDAVTQNAPFLAENVPRAAVTDYSGSLADDDLQSLNQQVPKLAELQAKVVVLPKHVHIEKFGIFARQLAEKWHVKDDRLLLIVNLGDSAVLIRTGEYLKGLGLTPAAIDTEVLPSHFIEHARVGKLKTAIYDSLDYMSKKLVQSARSKATAPGATSKHEPWLPPAPIEKTAQQPIAAQSAHRTSDDGILLCIGLFVAVLMAIALFVLLRKRIDNSKNQVE